MSQPPLSIHIKELENQLGTQLFIRHSRSVVLTHAGKILMEESRRLLVNANNVLARVEQIGREKQGGLNSGLWERQCGDGCARYAAIPQGKSNVDVLFREKMPAMQMALLERRELDAGIWRMATEPRLVLPAYGCMNRRFWWRA